MWFWDYFCFMTSLCNDKRIGAWQACLRRIRIGAWQACLTRCCLSALTDMPALLPACCCLPAHDAWLANGCWLSACCPRPLIAAACLPVRIGIGARLPANENKHRSMHASRIRHSANGCRLSNLLLPVCPTTTTTIIIIIIIIIIIQK
jgi:hypothetical protein